jgi:WD40 repeat protein
MVEKSIKDFLLASEKTEIIREKLEGHKDAVNSLDYLLPNKANEAYLQSNDGFQESGIFLSASDNGTSLIWDIRINKRVMLIQDKDTTQG